MAKNGAARARQRKRQRLDQDYQDGKPLLEDGNSAITGEFRPRSRQPKPDPKPAQSALDQLMEARGFHFDASKGKWFTLQKDHTHATISAADETRTLAKKKREQLANLQAHPRIQRKESFKDQVAGAVVLQEANFSHKFLSRKEAAASYCLSTFGATANSDDFPHPLQYPAIVLDASCLNPALPHAEVQAFKYDPLLKILYVAPAYDMIGPTRHYQIWAACLDTNYPFYYHRTPYKSHYPVPPADAFGLHLTAVKQIGLWQNASVERWFNVVPGHASFLFDRDGPCLALTKSLVQPDGNAFRPSSFSQAALARNSRRAPPRSGVLTHEFGCLVDQRLPCVQVGCRYGPQNRKTRINFEKHSIVNCSDTRIVPNMVDTLEIWSGTKNGIEHAIYGQGACFTNTCLRKPLIHDLGSVTAIKLIGDNLVSAGMLKGHVFGYDMRSNTMGDSKIRHPGQVTNISYVDYNGNYLVVNGIEDCLLTYDLRFMKDKLVPFGKPFGNAPQPTRLLTQPVHRFDHHNRLYPAPDLGFDVSQNLGIIAAAQGNGSIRIFSLKSGKTLHTLWAGARVGPFRNIQIVEEEDGLCRILTSRQHRIYDFAAKYGAPWEDETDPLHRVFSYPYFSPSTPGHS
ncbi:hypothetical protein BT63DRAFT_477077 [Microthyrium microscopicum]|uniref:WD40 repeat-like protein n=1 Tax=Microthyrium microscopicum TaxID=703497 RepID=A0A6A6ULG1_9PEZI|nr:hypothetical protein BT63DRAFT_477077 [Microthyrium microscopicum]